MLNLDIHVMTTGRFPLLHCNAPRSARFGAIQTPISPPFLCQSSEIDILVLVLVVEDGVYTDEWNLWLTPHGNFRA